MPAFLRNRYENLRYFELLSKRHIGALKNIKHTYFRINYHQLTALQPIGRWNRGKTNHKYDRFPAPQPLGYVSVVAKGHDC